MSRLARSRLVDELITVKNVRVSYTVKQVRHSKVILRIVPATVI